MTSARAHRCRTRPGGHLRVLLAVLVTLVAAAALALVPAASPAAAYEPWGRTSAADRPLRTGCHTYFFRYVVDPPRDEWMAEMFVVGPRGQRLHHAFRDGDFDPNRDRMRFTVCRPSTDPGVHKVRMKVTWYEDDPASTAHEGWVRPGRFRLYRP